MRHMVVGFNLVQSDEVFSTNEDFRHTMSYKSHNDEDFSFDEHLVDDGFLSALEDTRRQDPPTLTFMLLANILRRHQITCRLQVS